MGPRPNENPDDFVWAPGHPFRASPDERRGYFGDMVGAGESSDNTIVTDTDQERRETYGGGGQTAVLVSEGPYNNMPVSTCGRSYRPTRTGGRSISSPAPMRIAAHCKCTRRRTE
jgi:hypothetical protein